MRILIFYFIAFISFNTEGVAQSFFDDDTIFSQHHSGLLIFNVEDDSVLYSFNADKNFIPASTVKLLTVLVAYQHLNDSMPSIDYSIKNDTLFFSGQGDPTFLHNDFSEQPVFELLDNFEGQLAYIEPRIYSEPYGEGWAWEDYLYGFMCRRSLLPIYGNALNLSLFENGDFEISPSYFQDNFSFTSDTSITKPEIKRPFENNQFHVSIPSVKDTVEKDVPFFTDPDITIALLEDTLQRKIIRIETDTIPFTKASNMRYSYPLDSIYKRILEESDNFFAEQLLLQCSKTVIDSFYTEGLIERLLVNNDHFRQHKPIWIDGSGLSRYNLFSPNTLRYILMELHTTMGWDRLAYILPTANEGTFEDMLSENDTWIWAKTGSMSGIFNIAGFIQADSGKKVGFVFMNNNFNFKLKVFRPHVVRVLNEIKRSY